MAAQIYYEDVEAGSDLPSLEKNPTTRQLVQYAGASGHQVLNPESAVQVLADHPHLSALNGFVTNFSELYGVGVLITQQTAESSAALGAPPEASAGRRP